MSPSHHSDVTITAHSSKHLFIPEDNQQKSSPAHPDRRNRSESIGEALARHGSIRDAQSLASIDRPPNDEESLPPSKIYHPFSIPVLALLIPASIFGTLARLGLQALVTYDGQSIFPLAYIQATGCFIMGIGLGVKEPFGNLYVPVHRQISHLLNFTNSYGPLYTAMTTGESMAF